MHHSVYYIVLAAAATRFSVYWQHLQEAPPKCKFYANTSNGTSTCGLFIIRSQVLKRRFTLPNVIEVLHPIWDGIWFPKHTKIRYSNKNRCHCAPIPHAPDIQCQYFKFLSVFNFQPLYYIFLLLRNFDSVKTLFIFGFNFQLFQEVYTIPK
jgi:hypothetical protein